MEEQKDALFSFAFFRVGSLAAAQDIVQDAFLALYRRDDLLRIENPKAYLVRTVANRCADYHRTRKVHVPFDRLVDHAAEEDRPYVEQYVEIETLLRNLPAEQADVLRLVFVDNLSFVDAAELLNLSVNTVKSRYRYGLEKLRRSPNIKRHEP